MNRMTKYDAIHNKYTGNSVYYKQSNQVLGRIEDFMEEMGLTDWCDFFQFINKARRELK